jgi:hypothetical protein
VSENGLLSHLYTQTIFLPRQALDKHRENSKTDYRFLSDRTVQFDPVAKTVLPWYPIHPRCNKRSFDSFHRCCFEDGIAYRFYCDLHNSRPKTTETSAIRVS